MKDMVQSDMAGPTIMNFNDQNRNCHAERSSVIRPRSGIITLSISRPIEGPFASLRVT